jgi:hypothetical protein
VVDTANELFDLVLAGKIVGEPKQRSCSSSPRARIAFNKRRDRAHKENNIEEEDAHGP